MTKPRQLILELLAASNKALSAYEIRDRLHSAESPVDIVTVYRVLECLEENRLIHRVLDTGKVLKCQLEPEEGCVRQEHHHCHHLMICQLCGDVAEIHCTALDQVIQTLKRQTDFLIHSHSLEFYGTCGVCRSQPASMTGAPAQVL